MPEINFVCTHLPCGLIRTHTSGWCPWRGLNTRPLPYQGSALPLSYMGCYQCCNILPASRESFHHRCETLVLAAPAPGAGEGNRTLVISLEGFCSTIELHPHFRMVEGAGFEPAYSERADLQSAAINHSATPPTEPRIIADFGSRRQTGMRFPTSQLRPNLRFSRENRWRANAVRAGSGQARSDVGLDLL